MKFIPNIIGLSPYFANIEHIQGFCKRYSTNLNHLKCLAFPQYVVIYIELLTMTNPGKVSSDYIKSQ